MATPASPLTVIAQQVQIVRIHGPYEDAMIAGCELVEKIIDGQDAATKKELWTRYLDATKPLNDLAVEAGKQIANFLQGLGK
jgi:hypothetical protein